MSQEPECAHFLAGTPKWTGEGEDPRVSMFFNTMPHPVTLYASLDDDEPSLVIPPSDGAPRMTATEVYPSKPNICVGNAAEGIGIPATMPPSFQLDWMELPAPDSEGFRNAYYALVSPMLGRQAMQQGVYSWNGKVLASPNTGPGFAKRDATGRICGCTHLIVWSMQKDYEGGYEWDASYA